MTVVAEQISVGARWLADGRRVVCALLIDAEGSSPFEPGAFMLIDERRRDRGLDHGRLRGGRRRHQRARDPRRRRAAAAAALRRLGRAGAHGRPDVRRDGRGARPRAARRRRARSARRRSPRSPRTTRSPWRRSSTASWPARSSPSSTGACIGGFGGPELLDRTVARDLAALSERRTSALRHYGGGGEALGRELGVHLHAFGVPPTLVAVGAIDYSAAVAALAGQIGYRVVIVDAREAFARSDRFSRVAEVHVGWPDGGDRRAPARPARRGDRLQPRPEVRRAGDPRRAAQRRRLHRRARQPAHGRRPQRRGSPLPAPTRRRSRACTRRAGSTSARPRRRRSRSRSWPRSSPRGPGASASRSSARRARSARTDGRARRPGSAGSCWRRARRAASGRPSSSRYHRGRPLLEHALAAMAAAQGLERRAVVLGAGAAQVREAVDLHGFEVVLCEDWEEGQAASLRAGVAALADAVDAVVVTLGDQPEIDPRAIERIAGARDGRSDAIRATYGRRPGHPVLLEARAAARGPSPARRRGGPQPARHGRRRARRLRRPG